MENRNGMKEFFVLLIAAWHNLDFVFREEKTEKNMFGNESGPIPLISFFSASTGRSVKCI